MRTIHASVVIVVAVLLTACTSAIKLPVSSVTPAADISVKKKQDKNKNYVIELTMANLASPDRLTPPKNYYSIWIVTDHGATKNVGQITNKNAKKTTFKVITPFIPKQLFVTAENEGNLTYPSGTEITRTSLEN